MIRMRAEISPELRDALARVEPVQLLKVLRRSVRENADPMVQTVKANTPARTGLLRKSMGAAIRFNRRAGEVTAIVGPQDNTLVFDQATGLTLYTSKSMKTLRRNDDSLLRKLVGQGVERVSQRTPFKYVYGVEEGVRRDGRVARDAGGAKMLAAGYRSDAQPFVDGVGRDLFRFVTSRSTPSTN